MTALGLLVESESHAFTKRLPTFLPLIRNCVLQQKIEQMGDKGEGDRVDTCAGEEEEEDGGVSEMEVDCSRLNEDGEGQTDHLLISTLVTLSQILQECDIVRSALQASVMSEIWGK